MNKGIINFRDYRLAVFDIDGTLADTGHAIHPFTLETLARLRKAGFPFTLATGKSLPGARAQADLLGVDLPLILINGGMLQTRQGEVLHAVTLPEEIVRRVIDLCKQEQCDLVMYIGDGIYFKELNENLRPVYGHLDQGMHPIDAWSAISDRLGEVNKCLVVDTSERENLIRMGKLFEKEFSVAADIIHSSKVLLEVMPKGVNKAEGIRRLAASLGIKMEEVMAFGDFDNDVEMLKAVGLGVAVANASPRAKKAADLVVGSVDEQGPARFLAELLDRLPATK